MSNKDTQNKLIIQDLYTLNKLDITFLDLKPQMYDLHIHK